MGAPDEQRSEKAWEGLRAAAETREAGMFDIFGAYEDQAESGWVVRLDHRTTVGFADVRDEVGVLADEAENAHGLDDRVPRWDIEREIARQAALDEIAGHERPWSEVVDAVVSALTRAV